MEKLKTTIEKDLKQEKLKLLEEKLKLVRGLPHLYGWKNYPWMTEFLQTTNRDVYLTAANQIGKSSVQIRKMIDWATDTKKWPSLWRSDPRQFWYLYPSKDVADAEFRTKWVPDFLPKNEFKDHPVYGWKPWNNRGSVAGIEFNSGITLFFKSYSQDSSDLQTGTVDYVGCDEELPTNLYDELNFRRNARDGYFSLVFTATLGQEMWRLVMEPKSGEKELFPHAWKRQISLYDCQKFEDGTPSHWTNEKIARVIASCKSEAEVERRVHGRFVLDTGRKYPTFSRTVNVIAPHVIPESWNHYAGVDLGAGGDHNHPSTITFLAIRPDFKYGVVYKHWRGDDKVYTMGDVLVQFLNMRGKQVFAGLFYDYHAKDFGTIATRHGVAFTPAEKSHEIGEQVINVLFKNQMVGIFDLPETMPLQNEIASLKHGTDKRKAIDDSVDSFRYGVTKIPWNWEAVGESITSGVLKEEVRKSFASQAQEDRENSRRKFLLDQSKGMTEDIELEISAWNELYDY